MPNIEDFMRGAGEPWTREQVEPLLLVDDSTTSRSIVRSLLTSLGIYDVVEAGDARSAFDRIDDKRFALVICDIEMHPISGIEFLSALRSNGSTSEIPVIMMTANRAQKNVQASKQFRANQFLLPPFSVAALTQAIKNAVKNVTPYRKPEAPKKGKQVSLRRVARWTEK